MSERRFWHRSRVSIVVAVLVLLILAVAFWEV